ncbi:LysR substrate-binding domain-containing protein [Fodinicurvata halophila]
MVPASRPLAIAELAAYPVVTFPKSTTPYRQLEQLFASSQVAAPVLHGSASLFTVLHLVGDGFGIGLLPTRMAEAVGQAREQEKRLVRLPVRDEARVPDLNFVVCYLPARNREAGELITAAAREADQNDPYTRSQTV